MWRPVARKRTFCIRCSLVSVNQCVIRAFRQVVPETRPPLTAVLLKRYKPVAVCRRGSITRARRGRPTRGTKEPDERKDAHAEHGAVLRF